MKSLECKTLSKNSMWPIASLSRLFLSLALVCCQSFLAPSPCLAQPSAQPLDAARPISAHSSVFLEELTWMEVRDALAAGKTTAIIPTGGIEQSGPYLPVGKHNFILERTMLLLANELGDALVAPIVKYVPEGSIEPKTGHMRYPGTITLREDLFVEVLKDIARSLRANGFRTIVLLGDSGDNIRGLERATDQLNAEWANSDTKAIFEGAYYNYKDLDVVIAEKGYLQTPEGIHDDLAFTSQLLAIDEALVRYKERSQAGKLSINGVSITDKAKIQELGDSILKLRARLTAQDIKTLRDKK